MTPDPVLRARAMLGVAHRRGTPEELTAARRDLAAAVIEKTIRERLADAPPLTPEQAAKLAGLLLGGSR